ncbi:TetR family transcriptional regulator [Streptomyces sp. NPDC051219]|uniref:TetR family transcriptional regulator n=1 Tax=Streptomyces sp. NPDC051219 TaxID=3155283 RepID=UPI003414DB01
MLLAGALRTLVEQVIAKTSARSIAATAGVNQALVFYHFGSVAAIDSLAELPAFGREMHEEERPAGHVAVLGQLLAGAQSQPRLASATAAGLALWIEEIEAVLIRVLSATPLGGFADPAGLARAVAASFVGIELYEGVDEAGVSGTWTRSPGSCVAGR